MPAVNAKVLPGFRLSLGYTIFYLSLLVLIPIAAVYARACTLSLDEFWKAVSSQQALAAYGLTFGASLVAACINVVLGLLVAWVLVRYEFPLRRLFDAAETKPDFELRKVSAEVHIGDLARTNRIKKSVFLNLKRKAQLRTPIYWPSVARVQADAMLWADA